LVPSDPKLSQTRRRHARLRAVQPECLTITPQLPTASFEPGGSAPRRSPGITSGWNPHLATAFRSPVMTACRQATIPGSKFLACCFACVANLSPGPFGLRLLRSPRFAPVRARSAPQSRFPVPNPQSRPAAGSLLPFRAFCALPDQALQPSRSPRDSPHGCSRLPFAPRCFFYY